MKNVKETPWPIEIGPHPLAVPRDICANQQCISERVSQCIGSEASEELCDTEFSRECFRDPQAIRDLVLRHVRVASPEQFSGQGVFYIWLEKACPVECDFCFFQSPTKTERSEKTGVTPEGIERLISFINSANIREFFISGGGEPMLKRKEVCRLVEGVNVEKLVIVTSSYWSQTEQATERVLGQLAEAAEKNEHRPVVTVRLSLDQSHAERLSHGKGLNYALNLVKGFADKYAEHQQLKLLVHTMNDDDTVEELLRQLPVRDREDTGTYLKHKTTVTLENGFRFMIEYSQEFVANAEIDMHHNADAAELNAHTFQEYVEIRRAGNMSVVLNGEQPKGINWLMLYDGSMFVWGATSPDIEPSLYKHDHAEALARNQADPLTWSVMEKGTLYRENIIAEVSPCSVYRARGMGLRDFHARASLEEPSTRLYATIRILQDHIAEGRITVDDMKGWPEEVIRLVCMSRADLAEGHRSAGTILDQYLQAPDTCAQALLALQRRVALGHYRPLTVETMIERVSASDLPDTTKKEFFEQLLFSGVHAATLGGATSIPDVTRAPHSLDEAQPDPTDLPIIELKTIS